MPCIFFFQYILHCPPLLPDTLLFEDLFYHLYILCKALEMGRGKIYQNFMDGKLKALNNRMNDPFITAARFMNELFCDVF